MKQIQKEICKKLCGQLQTLNALWIVDRAYGRGVVSINFDDYCLWTSEVV